MTFEEFKFEIMQRVRSSDVNQFFHMYIKAKNWNDILKIFKIAEYYEWSFANNVIDFELLNEIPETKREAEGFYNRQIEINNNTSPIVLLNNGDLTISQSGENRCKIVMFGNSKLNATLSESAMIELEQYHTSQSQIMTKDDSFLHEIITNDAVSNMLSFGNSTIKLIQNNNANCTVTANDTSYLNAILFWDSKLELITSLENYNIIKRDTSKVTIANI